MITEQLKSIVDEVGSVMSKFEGKTILVSGACGFLGSWFVGIFQYLNQNVFIQPCVVYAIDSFIAADKVNYIVDIVDKNIHFILNDISKVEIDSRFDFIIHAAGIASPIHYRKYPLETIDGMVSGCKNLLESASRYGTESMLVFSSSEIYGNPSSYMVPTPETYNGNVSCTGPRSCYDESKRMEETLCTSYYRVHNTPVKWVRPFNVYGPGMRIDDDRVVPKFIFAALEKKPITVHIPGLQTRTFCYITDAMVGFFKTLLRGKNGEVYNIGYPGGEMSMVELAEKVKNLFKGAVEVIEIPMPPEYPQDQTQRRCPDLTKAKVHLDYDPKVDIDRGLELILFWSRELILGRGRREHIKLESLSHQSTISLPVRSRSK